MKFIKLLCALLMISSLQAHAQNSPAADPQQNADARINAAFERARAAMQTGPIKVSLQNQAHLMIPAKQFFFPAKDAKEILSAMGNTPGDDVMGLIIPEEGAWMVVARYEAAGYIKDDDAKNWDADDLLKSLKEGTLAGNDYRIKMGIPPMQVTAWAESPHYEATSQRLIWSAILKDLNGVDENPTINYNTYALGREGFVSLNLVTAEKLIATDKQFAKELLNNLEFNEGKRYADFNANTDKVAEYGLAALIAGAAAKKLGFFALIFAFLAKFAKVGLLALAGVGYMVKRWFTGKDESSASDDHTKAETNADHSPTLENVTSTSTSTNAAVDQPAQAKADVASNEVKQDIKAN